MATPKFKLKITKMEGEAGDLNDTLGISRERADQLVEVMEAVETLEMDENGNIDKMVILNGTLAKVTDFQEATFVSLVLGGYFAECDRKRAAEERIGSLLDKIKDSLG